MNYAANQPRPIIIGVAEQAEIAPGVSVICKRVSLNPAEVELWPTRRLNRWSAFTDDEIKSLQWSTWDHIGIIDESLRKELDAEHNRRRLADRD